MQPEDKTNTNTAETNPQQQKQQKQKPQPQQQPKPKPQSTQIRAQQQIQEPHVKSFIEGDHTFSNIINHLLKKPLTVIHTIDEKGGAPYMPIILMTTISLAVFGFILGSFHGASHQMWLAPIKIISGVLLSSLLCLPSLYIFCCIGGLNKKFTTILGIQSCTMAITSILLIGFAPILWLFSSSSSSSGFFGFICIAIWLICLLIGLKFLKKTGKVFNMKHTRHLILWASIFTLVTLQMPTTLRPIIGHSNNIIELNEKKFFIQHWLDELSNNKQHTTK